MSFLCVASDFHPYECDGPGKCLHCDRRVSNEHDPASCHLCDPDYDGQENEHWIQEKERP